MKNKIDVIICTNKSLIGLKNLVYQIFNQKGNFEIKIIIIHQSNSKNLYPNFIKNKKITYKNTSRQNLSAAKNIGLKLSTSNFISFLDDDVSIKQNYFYQSINILKKKKIDLLFSKINHINSLKALSKNMKNHDLNVNYFNLSCCLSSSMWIHLKNNKKNFFDEDLGLGAKYGSGEETDFIFNYLNKQKKVYYSSKVFIYHPNEFLNFKKLNSISAKFISYGKGQGAIFKKNYYNKKIISCYLFINSLIKSLVATLLYIFLLKNKEVVKYYSLFIGKIIGFKKYRKN